jgi:hypothetical protein
MHARVHAVVDEDVGHSKVPEVGLVTTFRRMDPKWHTGATPSNARKLQEGSDNYQTFCNTPAVVRCTCYSAVVNY